MKFKQAAERIRDIPHISQHSARILYDFLLTEQPRDCLELGFAHGASSGYIAAALDELERGHLTSVDLEASAAFDITIEETLSLAGLADRVSVVRERNSYNWFLKRQVEAQTIDGVCEPCYDFVFIDGSKNWTIDGMAFFLADKLLRPGGWILFDDYGWRYADAIERGKTYADGLSVRDMSDDQISEPNVAAIFNLCVVTHPDYGEFKVQDDSWAWAKKVGRNELASRSVCHERKSVLKSRWQRWRASR